MRESRGNRVRAALPQSPDLGGAHRHFGFVPRSRRSRSSANPASPRACHQIGEVGELSITDRLYHFGHRRVVSRARIALEVAQRLEKVILALPRQPGHIFVPGEIRVVAEEAMMLADPVTGRARCAPHRRAPPAASAAAILRSY